MPKELRTPLYQEHIALKAQMGPFGGWEMPIQYEGILAEHRHCRNAAAVFDICHMGEFIFRGDPASNGLDQAFSFNPANIPQGKCRYGFLLNRRGGILDDLIIYRISEKEFMIVVNSSTRKNDFKAIRKRLKGRYVLEDISGRTAKLDLQGPQSRAVLEEKFGADAARIPYFGFCSLKWAGTDLVISRTGYTGELGYELYFNAEKSAELWKLLIGDPRVKPAGLGARDILRLEMGYSLYGSDLDEQTTPIEAGLENFVDYGRNFYGKKALIRQKKKGIRREKIAFKVLSRRSPRHLFRILTPEGQDIGEVTSGCFSPMLASGIGLGFVKPFFAKLGERIVIRDPSGGQSLDAVITQLPFYRNGSLRN